MSKGSRIFFVLIASGIAIALLLLALWASLSFGPPDLDTFPAQK